MLEIVLENSADDKVIMAGTGCESTRETIRLTKQVASMGVKMVSLLMPNFFVKEN